MPLSVLKAGTSWKGKKLNRSLCFPLETRLGSRLFSITQAGFVWVHLGRKRRGKAIPHGVRGALLQHPLSINPIAPAAGNEISSRFTAALAPCAKIISCNLLLEKRREKERGRREMHEVICSPHQHEYPPRLSSLPAALNLQVKGAKKNLLVCEFTVKVCGV